MCTAIKFILESITHNFSPLHILNYKIIYYSSLNRYQFISCTVLNLTIKCHTNNFCSHYCLHFYSSLCLIWMELRTPQGKGDILSKLCIVVMSETPNLNLISISVCTTVHQLEKLTRHRLLLDHKWRYRQVEPGYYSMKSILEHNFTIQLSCDVQYGPPKSIRAKERLPCGSYFKEEISSSVS